MTMAAVAAPQPAHRSLLLPDGTRAQLDGPLRSGVPVVVLLHGFAGDAASLTGRAHGRGSWRDALLAAGFSTLSYRQTSPLGVLEPNVEQLLRVAAGLLASHQLRRLPLVLVAHSRGGLLARAFVDRAAQRRDLFDVLDRIDRVITLHSPHQGSGLAGLAVRMDPTARRLQLLVGSLGLRPSVLGALCALSASPAVAELAPGSTLLRTLGRCPPPDGIAWHTFGGISADLGRIQSLLGGGSGTLARKGDPGRFVRTRGVAEVLAALNRMAPLSPALREGEGDLVVADACARLPFASSHTVNRLTHLEALWSVDLHAQVVGLLGGRAVPAAA
jgi:pimeloyl-ACP methyl ester carboxylesterase